MLKHLRSTWLAGAGAALLVLSMTGLAAAATLVDDTTPATLSTFEDLNGNGIDDDCETAVAADAAAVTAAMAAVDVDADGVISVTEAAHSAWVGGTNCNHGGYVSTVAGAASDECDEDAGGETEDESAEEPNHAAIETAPVASADCTEDETEDAEQAETEEDAAKVCTVAPPVEGAPVAAPMSHVEVAQSDAVGGKNCNHGGAVSESAKAAKAERDAAKAEKRSARELKAHGHKAKLHGKHGQH
jgi:hypothetical protein